MIKENIVYGPPFHITIPKESSGIVLYNRLIKLVHSTDKSFIDEVTGTYLTYEELLQLSCSLAESLRRDGINKKDTIALCSENNIYFFVVVIAALFTGLPITLMNSAYTETELNYALDLVCPSKIFCSKSCCEKLLKLKPKHGYTQIIVTNTYSDVSAGVCLIKFIRKHEALYTDPNNFIPTPVNDPYHTAFLLFSSGTTGLPKGAMTSHRNINARLMSIYNRELCLQSTHPHVLGILPFFHTYGLQLVLGHIFEGKTTHVLEKFDPSVYLRCIERYRIDRITVVPTLLSFLATHPIVDKFDLSCLKDITYGGSPSAPHVLKAVITRLNITPRQEYGLTETTFCITSNVIGTKKISSVGMLYPGVSAYIRDLDTGTKLGPNRSGEVCIKGYMMTKGYYKNESATKKAVTEDGFFKTGDVGYYDDEENFYIIDRIKELIKYKSFQVAPAELESILITHPNIKQVAVVGLPDERAGELPMAFVIKEPDTDLNEDEVKSYLANFLSRNKHLHGGVIFTDEIPLNALGKICRKQVRQLLFKLKSEL